MMWAKMHVPPASYSDSLPVSLPCGTLFAWIIAFKFVCSALDYLCIQ